jgi:hypothetical protein
MKKNLSKILFFILGVLSTLILLYLFRYRVVAILIWCLFNFLIYIYMKKQKVLITLLGIMFLGGVVYATIFSNILQGGGEVQSAPAELEIEYISVSSGTIIGGFWDIEGVVGGEEISAEILVTNTGYSPLESVVLYLETSWGVVESYDIGELGVGESGVVGISFTVPIEGGFIDFQLEAGDVGIEPPPPSPFIP